MNYRCQKTIFKTSGELDEFFLFARTISLLDMIVQDKIKINEKNQIETSVWKILCNQSYGHQSKTFCPISLIFVKRTVFNISILWCKKKVKNSKIRFKNLVLSWQTFQKFFNCIYNIVSNGRSYSYGVSPLSLKLLHKPSPTNKTNQIFSYRNKIVYEIQQGWILAFYCPVLI